MLTEILKATGNDLLSLSSCNPFPPPQNFPPYPHHAAFFVPAQCILVSSALWAIHTIVTVDASMWRGWTLQGNLYYCYYHGGLQVWVASPKKNPPQVSNLGTIKVGWKITEISWAMSPRVFFLRLRVFCRFVPSVDDQKSSNRVY